MARTRLNIFFYLAFMAGSNALYADDTGIIWHGFFTAGGALSDSSTPYQESIDNKGTFGLTRFGLTASKELEHNWTVAGQVIAHVGETVGFEGEEVVSLDWAYATYRPHDSFNLLVGKIKYPNNLASEYLEVGYAYPWIRPPQEFYDHGDLGPHIASEALSGVSAIFRSRPGSGVRFSLQPFAGESSGVDGRNKKLVGLKTGMTGEGFEAIAGYSRSLLVLDATSPRLAETDDKYQQAWNLGASLERSRAVIYTEYGQSSVEDNPDFKTRAGYITAGYRFGKYLPHLTHARFKQDSGLGQSSTTLGLRYELSDSSAIKFEWQDIRPKQRTTPLVGGEQPAGLFGTKPTEDRINVYAATIDFVF